MPTTITPYHAKQIGSKYGLISAGLGLLVAYLAGFALFAISGKLSKALLWFTEFPFLLNIVWGALIILLLGYLLGQRAGIAILIKGRSPVITGILTGLEVLATTGFLSGLYGFFREGIMDYSPVIGAFLDYIVKPFFWIVFWGFIPAIVVGVWFANRIQN